MILVGQTCGVLAQERRGRMRPEQPVEERRPVDAPATAAEVEAAIARAKQFLYAQQHNGNWEESPRKQMDDRGRDGPMGGRGRDPVTGSQWGGLTSIATFALLAAGENDQDERMIKPLTFLKNIEITGTYALGLHAQVWNVLPAAKQKDFRITVRKDGALLQKGLRGSGDAKGLYHYTLDDGGWDNSCSQFGVLGMWACAQMGYETPTRYWKEVEEAWIRHQDQGGGWRYISVAGMAGGDPGRGPAGGGPPGGGGFMRGMNFDQVTLSMTAAGVATLFITQDYLHADAGIACKGNYRNPAIEAGMKWIGEHFNELLTDRHYFYTLFGISRIGLASGYKYVGGHDWYKEGAAQLVAYQRTDGSWGDSPVSDTAFALLFLVRGRAPVVINKLEYSLDQHGDAPKPGNWNQRPRDAASVTSWLSRGLERNLNWQVVNLSTDAAELHDSPILYLAGNQTLSFSEAEERKLREFVEGGGLILGNADCASKAFGDSFKGLGRKLFGRYEFRDLPAGHVIFGEFAPPVAGKAPVQLQGLSNGCRELMILIPNADPARLWQQRAVAGREELHQVLANIYLYAVDKANGRFKGESYVVQADAKIATQRTVKVARVECGDNWNPEPGGWRRLMAVMHNRYGTDLSVEAVPLEKNRLSGFALVHWTGTTAVRLNEAQRNELKRYVETGGTVVIDAAGGANDFADSVQDELRKIFGDAAKSLRDPLAVDHALYDGKPMEVGYRRFARKSFIGQLKTPRLRGIEVNGRLAVIFSAEDLSVGLVGQAVDGIFGYEPESATALMSCVVRYAAGK
jgi:hypothetical protein